MNNITDINENYQQVTDMYYKVEVFVVQHNLQEVLDAIAKTQHTPTYWVVERS